MFDLKHALEEHFVLAQLLYHLMQMLSSTVGCLQYLLICCMWVALEYCLLSFTLGLKIIFFFFLPLLKIHIQRTEGCDHMTCSQCNTNFCYRCGERYRQLRFFGDHTSNLSIFGCKYRYLPERPHLRRLVRGSVCGEWINTLHRELHKEVIEAGGVSVF